MTRLIRTAARGLAVVSLFASASRSARADPQAPTYAEEEGAAGQFVTFHDDPLAAGGFGPRDVVLTVRPSAARMVLVRPRTQFVSEMLKSVESL